MTVQETSAPTERASRPRRRAWFVLGCVGVVLLAALLVAGWKWRHPTALEKYGGWGVGRTDVRAGSTVYVTVTDPNVYMDGAVRVHGAAPHELADSTGASFAYLLCTPSPGPVTVGIETDVEMHQVCDSVMPATSGTMSPRAQQLLVAVTPRRPGVIVFHGVDVHYSHGWQDGTQRTGPDSRIRVIPAMR